MAGKKKRVSDDEERRENHDVATAEGELDRPVEGKKPRAKPPKEDPPETDDTDDAPKNFTDPDRAAIYDRSREAREHEREADDQALDNTGRVRALQLQYESEGRSDEELFLRLHDEGLMKFTDEELEGFRAAVSDGEDDDELDDEPPAGSVEDEDEDDENAGKSDLDLNADVYSIRVRGEESTAPRDRVIKAGIAALQKEVNNDVRAQELSEYEQSLKDLEKRVLDNAARGLDINGNPLKAPESSGLPDKDQSGAINEDEVRKKVQAVRQATFEGDDEGMENALADLITSVVQGRGQLTPTLDVDSLVSQAAEKVVERTQREQTRKIAERVNTTFRKDYAELHSDERLFGLTQTEFNRLRQERPDDDPVGLMREAGDYIRGLAKPGKGSGNIDDELDRRRRHKSRLNATRSQAGGSARQSKKPEPKPQSRSDAVTQMRKARGLD